jgi:hypothetical protein
MLEGWRILKGVDFKICSGIEVDQLFEDLLFRQVRTKLLERTSEKSNKQLHSTLELS